MIAFTGQDCIGIVSSYRKFDRIEGVCVLQDSVADGVNPVSWRAGKTRRIEHGENSSWVRDIGRWLRSFQFYTEASTTGGTGHWKPHVRLCGVTGIPASNWHV